MGSSSTRLDSGWATIKAGLRLGDKRAEATLTQRFVHGSFWALIGAVGTQVFTLLASVFTARMLGKEAFGQFSFLQGTVTTAATFTGFGLGLTATRYVASYRQQEPQRAADFIRFVMTVASVVSALAGAVMVLAAPYLAAQVFRLPELSISIRWSALYLFCVTVNGVQTGILAGFENFRAIASVNITRGISTLLLTLPLVWLWQLEGAVAAMGIAGALAYGMSLFQVDSVKSKNAMPKTTAFDWRYTKVLWTFSLPAVLGGVLVSPVTWLASLWLSRQPHGYAELGLFGAANQWRSAVSFIPGILSQPLLPLLTSLSGERKQSFSRLVSFSAVLNGGVAAGAGLFVALGLPLISMFYGKSFGGLNSVVVPLMAAGVITCAAAPIGTALASEDRMWIGLALNLIWACCLLTSARFAIHVAGAKGLAYSFLLAYMMHMFTGGFCLLCRRQTGSRPDEQAP